MHVSDPWILRTVRAFLFQVQVFGYLSSYAHTTRINGITVKLMQLSLSPVSCPGIFLVTVHLVKQYKGGRDPHEVTENIKPGKCSTRYEKLEEFKENGYSKNHQKKTD